MDADERASGVRRTASAAGISWCGPAGVGLAGRIRGKHMSEDESHPIPKGRRIALQETADWRPLKGAARAIAIQFGMEREAAGTLLYEGMTGGQIGHRDASPGAQSHIVTSRGVELAQQAGINYDRHINWQDGTLEPPWGQVYPLEVFWPDVERAVRQPAKVITPPRERGREPTARQDAAAAMLRDLKSGKQTAETLSKLKQEALAKDYGVRSRDTAVKARNEALSAFANKGGNK